MAADIRYLAPADRFQVATAFERNDCCRIPLLVLDTDGHGAMMRAHADCWHLASRYDALLAANIHPDFPEDRRIALARCRAWIVFQGYSTPLDMDCLVRFGMDADGRARWHYHAPTGQGEHVRISVTTWLRKDRPNTLHMAVHRVADGTAGGGMADPDIVTLIVRPDIEDRNFHDTTKAYLGPENRWPAAITRLPDGFRFTPADTHAFTMTVAPGTFGSAPEWQYMVHRPVEAQRGLDADSDLFSPGYFAVPLAGGDSACLTSCVQPGARPAPTTESAVPETPGTWPGEAAGWDPVTALTRSARHYIVQRDQSRTVIAGYPWFLDWGRDTLIAVRGLAAAGYQDACRDILIQFARFEDRGTLPNMIRGDDARNRDTSDAPLWFFTACADTLRAGETDLMSLDCGGRPLRRVLADMAEALIAGTPNGVVMDPASGLLFSPAHFTWMDTNYPAGTPREGYPIEIQALWLAALRFLADIEPSERTRWGAMADRVAESMDALFWDPQLGYLVDCRHGGPGTPAREALPDDALRPNQLLAVTLGAVTAAERMQAVVDQCSALIVPGAIRSLADRPVTVPLTIHHQGRPLNAPHAPYWGAYGGDEDTRRKPAYHNGTAWTWLFPSFCEAWAMAYGPDARATALAWLASSIDLVNSHCIGQMPEILDGNAPHAQRGCDAQAWGVSELLRVWRLLGE